jgi:hypothetical protein
MIYDWKFDEISNNPVNPGGKLKENKVKTMMR